MGTWVNINEDWYYRFAHLYGVGKRIAASSVLIATALSIGKPWGWLHILPYPPYRFTKSGLRFSAKARIPSF